VADNDFTTTLLNVYHLIRKGRWIYDTGM